MSLSISMDLNIFSEECPTSYLGLHCWYPVLSGHPLSSARIAVVQLETSPLVKF